MSGILKVRGKDGEFKDILAIKGASAYEQAVAGGFQGTEADFIQILNENLADFDGGHIVDKNNPHQVTPEQIGALPIKGGTLRGHLIFENPSGAFAIRKGRQIGDVTHSVALGIGSNGATALEHYTGDTLDGRLTLESVANNPGALKLRDSSTGAQYKIYGEHNKPTAADVGALSKNGGSITGYFGVYNKETPGVEICTDYHFAQIIKNASANVDGGLILCDYADIDETTKRLTLKLCHRDAKDDIDNALAIFLKDGNNVDSYKIYGEHNKPSSEYKGDGEAQTVEIGGKGNFLLIADGTGAMGIVSKYGTKRFSSSSVSSYYADDIKYEDGKLTFSTKTDLNVKDRTYIYQVL